MDRKELVRNKKKKNNEKLAYNAMWAGIFVTFVGLYVIPGKAPDLGNFWRIYNADTGVIGDTIGGIAGPILNFTGLLMVYFSLREQAKSNRIQSRQFKKEAEQGRNEREFDLTFKLLERLLEQASHFEKAFIKIGELDSIANWNGKLGATQSDMRVDDELYEQYRREVLSLSDVFLMIVKRLESPTLTLDQQAVLQRILSMQYEPRLRDGEKGYTAYFNEENESPELLKTIRQQLHVLQTQRKRIEEQTKVQASTAGK